MKIIRKKSDQQIYLAYVENGAWKYHGPYKTIKGAQKARERRQKDDLMRSLGLTKVKGAVSGDTYWE